MMSISEAARIRENQIRNTIIMRESCLAALDNIERLMLKLKQSMPDARNNGEAVPAPLDLKDSCTLLVEAR